jgi:CubicO group peptidase (beta-lactamase class C family)
MLTTTECAERIHTEAAGNTIEPGTVFNYGGSHMQVAGAMAIAASGRANWAVLFREHVGDPLGMSPEAGFRPNPMIAGGASMSLDDYAKFVQAIFARTLLAASLAEMERDHTPLGSVTIGFSPLASTGFEWHYGLGHWRECYQPAWSSECDQHVRVSSPGAFGFYPLIDRSGSYWLILAREDMSAMSGAASVELNARLTPAIEAALGIQ